ncbi:MAG: glycerol-3-phosphate 1-O-acyltransferase PlsB [Lysobacterales bacterium]
MPETLPARSANPLAQRPLWLRVAGALLRPWIAVSHQPLDVRQTVPDSARPLVYVIERHGLSNWLILDVAAREAGLPSPYEAARELPVRRHRAVISVSRMPRGPGGRPGGRPPELLAALAARVRSDPSFDVAMVPVSIFVGRVPERETGWFRVLFSENWVVVGRFRRLLAILLNGRDTLVQFSAPVSLRAALASTTGSHADIALRKLARVMRTHFRRVREMVIGPDLSHRRTVVDALLNAEPVRTAIAAAASRDRKGEAGASERARDYAMEIAADYSHPVVRSLYFLLTWFWNKLYDGIDMHHFDTVRDAAPGREVIYVPCHRSHIDYLLLSYQLLRNGIAVPHIGAGINLNLPVLGSILRRGGAFFLRRSFKGDPLYSTVFREYLSQLFARGVSLEYFIEGGRSRTGRLLAPRGGMLSMTLRSFLNESRRPVVFIPVYIGYEKMMEGDAYVGELSGRPKEKESLLGLLRTTHVLREAHGRVALNFGEPIQLTPLLDELAPAWREAVVDPTAKPEWLNGVVATLAERIQRHVNAAAHLNPVNLLAVSLLATPKHAMAEADLLAQIDLNRSLVAELPYSDRVTWTDLGAREIIAYGEKMQWIRRVSHPLGDVLVVDPKPAVLLSYFRNNVLHLFATAAWVACCFVNNRRMAHATVRRLGRLVYPFLQAELFLPWSEVEFASRIDATIAWFSARGLLELASDGLTLTRGPGQGDEAFHLRTVAHSLLQAFERYYIALALLVTNGRGALTAGELENLCCLTAQRLSLLHELSGPEFFDRALFRGFIQKLREGGVVWAGEDGRLDFDSALENVARDARVVLSRDIRHGILKLTSEKRADLAARSESIDKAA